MSTNGTIFITSYHFLRFIGFPVYLRLSQSPKTQKPVGKTQFHMGTYGFQVSVKIESNSQFTSLRGLTMRLMINNYLFAFCFITTVIIL